MINCTRLDLLARDRVTVMFCDYGQSRLVGQVLAEYLASPALRALVPMAVLFLSFAGLWLLG